MTLAAVIGALELGIIYAILALGVFLSYRTLNTADLTVDSSIVTGAAVSAVIISQGGNPFLALLASFFCGSLAGAVTALLNIKLKIEPLLAGILVMLGLYSVNLRIMGGKPNIALTQVSTLFTFTEPLLGGNYSELITVLILLIAVLLLFYLFLNTRSGFALRATGDNEFMVRASGVNSDAMKLIGLSLSNGFVGLAGGLLSQYQSFCDITMGTGMVVIGLASVIIGETIFELFNKKLPLLLRLTAVCVGAVLYRLAITWALYRGMPAMDLKLISALVVTLALSAGTIKGLFHKKYNFSQKNEKAGA